MRTHTHAYTQIHVNKYSYILSFGRLHPCRLTGVMLGKGDALTSAIRVQKRMFGWKGTVGQGRYPNLHCAAVTAAQEADCSLST